MDDLCEYVPSLPCDPNISFPKPDIKHLYQYMTTGHIVGVPVYISTQYPEDISACENTESCQNIVEEMIDNEKPVIPSKDVGVQISEDDYHTKDDVTSASRKESKLVREVRKSKHEHNRDRN